MPAFYAFVNIDDEKSDFWKDNPDVGVSSPFAEFKKSDKNSSDIMKAIYLIYDPKSLFNVAKEPRDKVIIDVTKNFLKPKEKDFSWSKYAEIIKAYEENCKTVLQRQYEVIVEDYEGFVDYYSSLSWQDDEEAALKTKYMKTLDEYTTKIKDIKKLVDGEEKEQKFKFDYRKSPLELAAGKNAKA